jgi:hypothetical protein
MPPATAAARYNSKAGRQGRPIVGVRTPAGATRPGDLHVAMTRVATASTNRVLVCPSTATRGVRSAQLNDLASLLHPLPFPDLAPQVHDIEDLAASCRSLKMCPYYTARELARGAELVFAPYR